MVHIRMLRGKIPELVSGHLDAWEEAMSNVKVGEVEGFLGGENKGKLREKTPTQRAGLSEREPLIIKMAQPNSLAQS